MTPPTVALVSFRLFGPDGVSVEAAKWADALATLGFRVTTVAGHGPVDHLLPGLAIEAPEPPAAGDLEQALSEADLVVVENLCSLPLNPGAASVLAKVLAGRPALLHHHDLPWQRDRFAGFPPPPDDPAWAHVTINELSRDQLADHGIGAVVVRNTFLVDPDPGDREATRAELGIGPSERLVLQPTRALARKNVAGGMALAEALGASYWLLGAAEDGYGPELDRLVARARTRVLLGWGPGGSRKIADAYAACDVVTLPSTWEGFGNPAVESAVFDRPLAIGPYPVATELARYGFDWFTLDESDRLAAWLEAPDPDLLAGNHEVARRHFSEADLPDRIEAVLHHAGWDDLVTSPGP